MLSRAPRAVSVLECGSTKMEAYNFFLDEKRHLRSGWRLAIFAVAFLVCVQVSHTVILGFIILVLRRPATDINNSLWSIAAGHGSLLFSAAVVGIACGKLLEELPVRAFGCSPHRGWLKNFAVGSAMGAASLFLAAGLATLTRGIHFTFHPAGARLIGQTLAVSLLIFIFAAAAEEVLFRGYPLQTLTRARLGWLGVVLTSAAFAAVHLQNPNVVPLSFPNTLLAGVLLAIGYVRTRSLWFPIGWHWAWNWTMASLLGLPVSGIERLAPAPLLKAFNSGPDWFTGGAYGIEGGAACTVALLISIVVIWKAKLFTRADVPKEDTSEARA